MSHPAEEQVLIEGIKNGDPEILKAFYKKNLPLVQHYILKNSGSPQDAEDVFQDAIILVYQKLESSDFKLTSSLSTFVYAVAKNIWLTKLRRFKKIDYNDDLIDETKELSPDLVNEIEQNEQYYVFRKYFLLLSNACQKLLELFFEGQPMKVIAKKMELSEGYTRKKKFECKNELLKMIEKDAAYKELTMTSKKSDQ